MIKTFLKPKHTLKSVAKEIEAGLNHKTIYLNDRGLKEAGYEIHEFGSDWFNLELPLAALSVTLAFTVTLIAEYKYKNLSSIIPLILYNVAVILPLLVYRLRPIKKRFITKKSSRR